MDIALQFLPLAINLIVAQFFLATLKQGNTPLITAIARTEQDGILPPGLANYTRRLTGAWGGFLIVLGLSHLLSARSPALHLHPALELFIDPVLIVFFFAIEYAWRVRRFPHYRFAPPWKLWGLIRRSGGIYKLYRQCTT